MNDGVFIFWVFLKPGDVVEWGSPAFGFASQAVVIDDEG